MSLKFEFDKLSLATVCQRWNVVELNVFGSILRGDFRVDSDIDVLVTLGRPLPGKKLDVLLGLQSDLERLSGRRVDVVGRYAIGHSPNQVRRRSILDHCERLYAAE